MDLYWENKDSVNSAKKDKLHKFQWSASTGTLKYHLEKEYSKKWNPKAGSSTAIKFSHAVTFIVADRISIWKIEEREIAKGENEMRSSRSVSSHD